MLSAKGYAIADAVGRIDRPKLVKKAAARLQNIDDAEDAVQDALCAMLARGFEFDNTAAYFRRAVWNATTDVIRARIEERNVFAQIHPDLDISLDELLEDEAVQLDGNIRLDEF